MSNTQFPPAGTLSQTISGVVRGASSPAGEQSQDVPAAGMPFGQVHGVSGEPGHPQVAFIVPEMLSRQVHPAGMQLSLIHI